MAQDSIWFNKVKKLQLPAVIPVQSLPTDTAKMAQLLSAVREDPLLTIHLFQYANKLSTSREVSVHTLQQAAELLGMQRITNLAAKIPRVDPNSASNKGLLRAIGDSLLAASLMRQWFEIRQIPWTESDYWLTLFYDLGIWVCWLLEPEKMDSIELNVKEGERREDLISELLGMPLRDWNDQLCRYYQLPISNAAGVSSSSSKNNVQPFKQSALKFFLPFSHDLAFAARQDWQSQQLAELCRNGEIALGLTEFKPQLKRWVAIAAREFKLAYASLAARRLLAQQPFPMDTSARSGFSDKDLALASKLSQPKFVNAPELKKPAILVTQQQTPKQTQAAAPKPAPKPAAVQTNTLASLTTSDSIAPKKHLNPRPQVKINELREIRRQFRNPKAWHSPVEIQESALYGLKQALSLSRIVVLEMNNGFWQAFDHEGCHSHPLMRNLKFPKYSADIVTELSKRTTALWVNDRNRQKAEKQLPPPLVVAADSESFFLRSFAIDNVVTMLLYADAFDQNPPLNDADYQLFREFCADWNTALNNVRLSN